MILSYKICSLLLSYPNEEIQELLKDVVPALMEESRLETVEIKKIEAFVKNYSEKPLIEWQEQYVQLFDLSGTVSLNLFEHVHGISKERGQAMVDLTDEYAEAGLELKTRELPDYLPVFLEYLSLLSPENAASMLSETVHILAAIKYRLGEKSNFYASVFSALISLSGKPVEEDRLREIIQKQKPVNYDRDYEDEVVTLGGSHPCKDCK